MARLVVYHNWTNVPALQGKDHLCNSAAGVIYAEGVEARADISIEEAEEMVKTLQEFLTAAKAEKASASRDPLAPPSARPASLVSRQPTAHSEFTQEELISGERLTLVVRKHAGTPLTREEEARLLLLTERLDGRSRSENFGGEDTARIGLLVDMSNPRR